MRKLSTLLLGLTLCCAVAGAAEMEPNGAATDAVAEKTTTEEGWVSLFDGKTLDGWKASEKPGSFKVEDGELVVNGPRSHLFYVGDERPFKNFEFKAEVLTKPNSNAGLYIHTKYQDDGWPKYGFEVQVNNSHSDWKRTASLYDVVNVRETVVPDDEWFTLHVIVNGNRIITRVNDKTMVDYLEPADQKAGEGFTRKIDEGTFAIQAHDPESKVLFRDIKVKRLP